MPKTDIINIDVPTFLRLLELSREEVADDADLHHIATISTRISKDHAITMEDYDKILEYCETCKLEELKKRSGI